MIDDREDFLAELAIKRDAQWVAWREAKAALNKAEALGRPSRSTPLPDGTSLFSDFDWDNATFVTMDRDGLICRSGEYDKLWRALRGGAERLNGMTDEEKAPASLISLFEIVFGDDPEAFVNAAIDRVLR